MCRSLARRGVRVAPFKAQNMSNNSAVVLVDGRDGHHSWGEIGRAQALQAFAAGITPSVDMNPVLLKPEADHTSQLVVRGEAVGAVSATNYIQHRQWLRTICAEALDHLREHYDVVLCEGAGSPAEVNLRETDVANMGLAQAADLPVIVVGDIDRGGVLAHFYGTYHILDEADRRRIVGFIVNKFRGDVRLLEPGLHMVTERTDVPVLGVLPFIPGLWIDAEDSLSGASGRVGPDQTPLGRDVLTVAAVRLPRVSNSTDVEALACEPGVDVTWTTSPGAVAAADLVVIPGSKSTVSDLAWLRRTGIAEAIVHRVAAGKPVLGICGGFQMLCRQISDPGGVESRGGAGAGAPAAGVVGSPSAGAGLAGAPSGGAAAGNDADGLVPGLGLLDADIAFFPEKTLRNHGTAYEIHHGRVVRRDCDGWIEEEDGSLEGAHEGTVWGTHRHGQLEDDQFRREFVAEMAQLCHKSNFVPGTVRYHDLRLQQVDLMADVIDAGLGADWAERLDLV